MQFIVTDCLQLVTDYEVGKLETNHTFPMAMYPIKGIRCTIQCVSSAHTPSPPSQKTTWLAAAEMKAKATYLSIFLPELGHLHNSTLIAV